MAYVTEKIEEILESDAENRTFSVRLVILKKKSGEVRKINAREHAKVGKNYIISTHWKAFVEDLHRSWEIRIRTIFVLRVVNAKISPQKGSHAQNLVSGWYVLLLLESILETEVSDGGC